MDLTANINRILILIYQEKKRQGYISSWNILACALERHTKRDVLMSKSSTHRWMLSALHNSMIQPNKALASIHDKYEFEF